MAELGNYEVVLNGMSTTMQLTPDEAKVRGGKLVGETRDTEADAAESPRSKSRNVSNKARGAS